MLGLLFSPDSPIVRNQPVLFGIEQSFSRPRSLCR
jgi:hypothetical protein